MKKIPDPIFKTKLSKISWKKIYTREYGVQYSEVAVSLLAFAKYHFPNTSFLQIVVPDEGSNTAFYIDNGSWIKLVTGLNKKYTHSIKNLEEYEKQFLFDGENYLNLSKKIAKLNLGKVSNKELLNIFLDYKDKRDRYSCFAWSAFILNNYVADKAAEILDSYIKDDGEKHEVISSVLRPEKLAAILKLQHEVERFNGKLNGEKIEDLYQKFKWLSCLDIHNRPWTKEEFREHIKSFKGSSSQKQKSFEELTKKLKLKTKDSEYLKMARRFIYIKDARDDFRRESVFYSENLWEELGRRIGIPSEDATYLQDKDVVDFLNDKSKITKKIISQRKKGFVLYIGESNRIICIQDSDEIKKILKLFKLGIEEKKEEQLVGRVASKGMVVGKVAIVKGVGDLEKVKKGDILIAVTTHPDYVPAMRRAGAIVTDEGGITSHAAIVSREFCIPCIVGTKNATKLLKDGETIQVNAVEGWIKKL